MGRSTTEVLHDHLMKRMQGDLEGDIRDNFDPDAVVLSGYGTYRGHDGIRQSAQQLARAVGEGGEFTYSRTIVEGEYGFLEWKARDGDTVVHDGADSFHVVDGRIRMQTCHYTVRRA